MSKFLERIKQIASENEKVAMFVDMDGTILGKELLQHMMYTQNQM